MTAWLYTGLPHAGKSTAVAATAKLLRLAGVPLSGFFTTEVLRPDGSRAGFDLIPVAGGPHIPLARTDWADAPTTVGRYGVHPNALSPLLTAGKPGQVTVLDEIGRMQLLHPGFADWVQALLNSGATVIGTIHSFTDPVTDAIKARTDVRLHTVEVANRDRLPAASCQAVLDALRR